MVNASHANRDFPYLLLVALRSILAPVCVLLTLLLSMQINNVRMIEAYYALMIIARIARTDPCFRGRGDATTYCPPRLWNISLSVISRWALIIGILLLLGYATKMSSVYSRMALFTWFLITPPLLVVGQLAVDMLASRYLLDEGTKRRVVIAGADELGHKLAQKILASPLSRMRIEGFFDDRGKDRLLNGNSLPLLGTLKELPAYIRNNDIDVIFIALPIRNVQRELLTCSTSCTIRPSRSISCPTSLYSDLIQCRTSDIDGLPVVALCETPVPRRQGARKGPQRLYDCRTRGPVGRARC